MTPGSEHIARLFDKYLKGEISPEELEELESWRQVSPRHDAAFEEMLDGQYLSGWLHRKQLLNKERALATLQQQFPEMKPTSGLPQVSKVVRSVSILRTAWLRYAAAIILLFGAGTYFYFRQQKLDTEITRTEPSTNKKDILPGTNRAVLTLSGGQQVVLDSTAAGIIRDGALSIENSQGSLSYSNTDIALINTITTPKGGQFQLTLADGTKVWLNAASSITYPTAFTDKKREVKITGEVFFDVAPNASRSFVVRTPEEEIVVLGTAFNVNAYPDENGVKTSLLNGRVKIGEKILMPGQAFLNGHIAATDIDQDLAWKNGIFNFRNIPIDKAMRQLARWYDIEIVYDAGVPKKMLDGEMDRDISLKDALDGLDGMGASFRIEGRILHVRALQ